MLENLSNFIGATVRPLAIVILLCGVTWGFVEGRVDGAAYLTLAGAAVAYLFADRTAANAHAAGVQAGLTMPAGATLENPLPVPTQPRRNPPARG